MRKLYLASFLLLSLTTTLVVTACGEEDRGGGTLDIDLSDWAVAPNLASLPAGDITFNIKNLSQEHDHELVIIRTDLAPEELPTESDRSVDQGAGGVDVVGKIREIGPGEDSSGTFTLKAGRYVLICNLVDEHDGQTVSHYQEGMRVPFTAE